jgi:hypothetical protein
VLVLVEESFEERFFIFAGVAGGDETESVAARGVDNRPVTTLDQANSEMPRLTGMLRGQNNNRACPERRSGSKADAVLHFVARAFTGVPVEIQL